MRVKEVMKSVRIMGYDSSAKQAAVLMKKLKIGSIVITDDSRAVGIVTERDLLTKITAENKLPSKIKIKDIMSRNLITIEPDDSVEDAVYLMIQHKIKKLPVVKNEELLGIITSTDLVKNSEEIGEFYFFD
ncbi:cyclic nucleotide-binding/CBS domain-containing protein [Nanoarchaeota archaeon]